MMPLLFLGAAPAAVDAFDQDAADNMRRHFFNNCPAGRSERSK